MASEFETTQATAAQDPTTPEEKPRWTLGGEYRYVEDLVPSQMSLFSGLRTKAPKLKQEESLFVDLTESLGMTSRPLDYMLDAFGSGSSKFKAATGHLREAEQLLDKSADLVMRGVQPQQLQRILEQDYGLVTDRMFGQELDARLEERGYSNLMGVPPSFSEELKSFEDSYSDWIETLPSRDGWQAWDEIVDGDWKRMIPVWGTVRDITEDIDAMRLMQRFNDGEISYDSDEYQQLEKLIIEANTPSTGWATVLDGLVTGVQFAGDMAAGSALTGVLGRAATKLGGQVVKDVTRKILTRSMQSGMLKTLTETAKRPGMLGKAVEGAGIAAGVTARAGKIVGGGAINLKAQEGLTYLAGEGRNLLLDEDYAPARGMAMKLFTADERAKSLEILGFNETDEGIFPIVQFNPNLKLEDIPEVYEQRAILEVITERLSMGVGPKFSLSTLPDAAKLWPLIRTTHPEISLFQFQRMVDDAARGFSQATGGQGSFLRRVAAESLEEHAVRLGNVVGYKLTGDERFEARDYRDVILSVDDYIVEGLVLGGMSGMGSATSAVKKGLVGDPQAQRIEALRERAVEGGRAERLGTAADINQIGQEARLNPPQGPLDPKLQAAAQELRGLGVRVAPYSPTAESPEGFQDAASFYDPAAPGVLFVNPEAADPAAPSSSRGARSLLAHEVTHDAEYVLGDEFNALVEDLRNEDPEAFANWMKLWERSVGGLGVTQPMDMTAEERAGEAVATGAQQNTALLWAALKDPQARKAMGQLLGGAKYRNLLQRFMDFFNRRFNGMEAKVVARLRAMGYLPSDPVDMNDAKARARLAMTLMEALTAVHGARHNALLRTMVDGGVLPVQSQRAVGAPSRPEEFDLSLADLPQEIQDLIEEASQPGFADIDSLEGARAMYAQANTLFDLADELDAQADTLQEAGETKGLQALRRQANEARRQAEAMFGDMVPHIDVLLAEEDVNAQIQALEEAAESGMLDGTAVDRGVIQNNLDELRKRAAELREEVSLLDAEALAEEGRPVPTEGTPPIERQPGRDREGDTVIMRPGDVRRMEPGRFARVKSDSAYYSDEWGRSQSEDPFLIVDIQTPQQLGLADIGESQADTTREYALLRQTESGRTLRVPVSDLVAAYNNPVGPLGVVSMPIAPGATVRPKPNTDEYDALGAEGHPGYRVTDVTGPEGAQRIAVDVGNGQVRAGFADNFEIVRSAVEQTPQERIATQEGAADARAGRTRFAPKPEFSPDTDQTRRNEGEDRGSRKRRVEENLSSLDLEDIIEFKAELEEIRRGLRPGQVLTERGATRPVALDNLDNDLQVMQRSLGYQIYDDASTLLDFTSRALRDIQLAFRDPAARDVVRDALGSRAKTLLNQRHPLLKGIARQMYEAAADPQYDPNQGLDSLTRLYALEGVTVADRAKEARKRSGRVVEDLREQGDIAPPTGEDILSSTADARQQFGGLRVGAQGSGRSIQDTPEGLRLNEIAREQRGREAGPPRQTIPFYKLPIPRAMGNAPDNSALGRARYAIEQMYNIGSLSELHAIGLSLVLGTLPASKLRGLDTRLRSLGFSLGDALTDERGTGFRDSADFLRLPRTVAGVASGRVRMDPEGRMHLTRLVDRRGREGLSEGGYRAGQQMTFLHELGHILSYAVSGNRRIGRDGMSEASRALREGLLARVPLSDPVFKSMFRTSEIDYFMMAPESYSRSRAGLEDIVDYARGGEFGAQSIGAALDERMFEVIREAGLLPELGALSDGYLMRLRDMPAYRLLAIDQVNMRQMPPDLLAGRTQAEIDRGAYRFDDYDESIDEEGEFLTREARQMLIDTVRALGYLGTGSLSNTNDPAAVRSLAVNDMATAALRQKRARDGSRPDIARDIERAQFQEAVEALNDQTLLYEVAEEITRQDTLVARDAREDAIDTPAIDTLAQADREDAELSEDPYDVRARNTEFIEAAYRALNVPDVLAREAEMLKRVTAEYVTESDRQAIRDFVREENRKAQEALEKVQPIIDQDIATMYVYPTTLRQRARFAAGFEGVNELRQWLQDSELINERSAQLEQSLMSFEPRTLFATGDRREDSAFEVTPEELAREAEIQGYFDEYDERAAAERNAQLNRERMLPAEIERLTAELTGEGADLAQSYYDLRARLYFSIDLEGAAISDNRGRYIMARALARDAFALLDAEKGDKRLSDSARLTALGLIGIAAREQASGDLVSALRDMGTKYAPIRMYPSADISLPPMTRWRKFWQQYRDRYARIEDLEQFLLGMDPSRSGRLESETSFGKAQLSAGLIQSGIIEMRRDFEVPIVDLMKEYGLEIEQVEDYLMALAAPAINKQLRAQQQKADQLNAEARELRQEAKSLKGRAAASNLRRANAMDAVARRMRPQVMYEYFTDEQAAEVRKKYENMTGMPQTASLVHDMVRRTRRIQRESGIISAETERRWNKQEPFYVPMRDAEVDPDSPMSQDPMLQRRVFSVWGPVAQQRRGRTSRPSPLAWAFAQHRQAVIAGAANKVAVELLDALESAGLVQEKRTMRSGEAFQASGYDFRLFVDGNPVAVTVTDRDLAASIGALSPEVMPRLLRALGTWTKLLARSSTSWSPDFVARNLARDTETALMKISQYRDMGVKVSRRQMSNNIVRMLYTARQGLKGTPTGEYGEYYERWRRAGGMTGLISGRDVTDIMSDLKSDLSGVSLGKVFDRTLGVLEAYAAVTEHAVRAATFKSLAEQGVPDSEAALLSRRVTVDFNRVGLSSSKIGAAYMFFSAGVGGAANTMAAIAKSPRFRKLMLSLVAYGAVEEFVFNAMDDEDPVDGLKFHDKIPSYQRHSHVFFPDFADTQAPSYRIPLPIGIGSFKALGNELARVAMGKTTASKAGIEWAVNFANSWSPIAGEPTLSATLAPSVLDTIVAINTNKAWHGGTIRSVRRPGDHLPDHLRGPNASNLAQDITKGLFEFFGGKPEEASPFAPDVDPNSLDYFMENIFSTGGRSIWNAVTAGYDAWQGNVSNRENRTLVKDAFVVQRSPADSQAAFFDIKEELDRRAQYVRVVEKRGDGPEAQAELKRVMNGHGVQIGFAKAYDKVWQSTKPLRDQLYAAETPEARKLAQERLETIYGSLVKGYNKAAAAQAERLRDGGDAPSQPSILQGIVRILEGTGSAAAEYVRPVIDELRAEIGGQGE